MSDTKKTTLTFREIYTLEAELAGVVDRQSGEKKVEGLLALKLNMLTKYHLNKLYSTVKTEKETIDKLRDELIQKLGEKDDSGNVSIPYYVDAKVKKGEDARKEINPNMLEFQKEIDELLASTKEIEHFAFTIDQFAASETGDAYEVFFKILG